MSITDLFRLDNGVAVVTGGAGRLGSQYARVLAEAGACVAVLGIAHAPGAAVQQLLEGHGGRACFHTVDVTERGAVDNALAEVTHRFGPPTVLINNAGLGSSPADVGLETGPFEQYPESAWDAMID